VQFPCNLHSGLSPSCTLFSSTTTKVHTPWRFDLPDQKSLDAVQYELRKRLSARWHTLHHTTDLSMNASDETRSTDIVSDPHLPRYNDISI